jgi:hypothetical protein
MDLLLGSIAFAALMLGQFAAVVAVHGEQCRSRTAREASPSGLSLSADPCARDQRLPANYRAQLIEARGG